MVIKKIPYKFKLLILPLLLCSITMISAYYLLDTMPKYYEILIICCAGLLAGLQIRFFANKNLRACQITNYVIFYLTAVFFVIIIIYFITHLMIFMDYDSLVYFLQQHNNYALFIFIAICYMQPIMLPLPEPFTIIAGSAVLGPFKAFLGSYLGTSLGIITMFTITRLGGNRIKEKKGHKMALKRYYHYVDKYGQWVLLVLLIFPVLPDEIICLGAGFSSMSYRKFIPIVLIAKPFSSYGLSYLPHLFT